MYFFISIKLFAQALDGFVKRLNDLYAHFYVDVSFRTILMRSFRLYFM